MKALECMAIVVSWACVLFADGPINANATTEARKLLAYMENWPSGKNGSIFGQNGEKEAVAIHDATGKWPGLYEKYLWQRVNRSSDPQLYAKNWLEGWKKAESYRQTLVDFYKRGAIVSLHMPIPNPKNKTEQGDKDFTDADMRKAYTEDGNSINKNLQFWLDSLCDHVEWIH
ncbi:MAG: hypothetical protein GF331_12855, partial [Chitinivibrionales bacterium]|nr:hypothetical protein [Chitinivibrionales bacterium]